MGSTSGSKIEGIWTHPTSAFSELVVCCRMYKSRVLPTYGHDCQKLAPQVSNIGAALFQLSLSYHIDMWLRAE